FYVAGNGGKIAHYDGRPSGAGWEKIESGTELQFLDIYGAEDDKTGEMQILAVSTRNYPPENHLYSIIKNTATEISTYIPSSQYNELWSVWFIPERHYYIVGSGIYEKHLLTENGWKNGPLDYTTHSTTKIRGNNLNDIIVVGAYGEVLHYNGLNWKSFHDETGLNNGSYSGLAFKGNLIITVGGNNALGVITVGKR
ncbi:MAG: glucosyl transferase, partial [Chlorobi bacterium]|nr:glucosyl transferase [Chlorobiota bacterium]